jgi:hypothetical protein
MQAGRPFESSGGVAGYYCLTYGRSRLRFALDTAPHSSPITLLHYLSRHWITSFRLFQLMVSKHNLW